MGERVTQAELARRLGVSRQAINALQNQGRIPRSPDGRIDEDEARRAIAMSVHPASKTASAVHGTLMNPASPPIGAEAVASVSKDPEMSYHVAKTLREVAEAQIAALKLRSMKDELGPRAELDRQLRAAIVRAREYLRREAPRLSMLMEGESRDQRTARLVETFDEFLRRLASWQTADQGDDALDEAETDADA